jgi:gluconate 2-dehydrogenase gamma chain
MNGLSRRAFLSAVGTGVGAVWLAAETGHLLAAGSHALTAARTTPPPPFEVLSPEQGADLAAIAAQIIPTDETPGAREAGVIFFIDRSLATFAKAQRPALDQGWKDLRKRVAKTHPGQRSFAALSDTQQIALLTALEKEKSSFFQAMRGATLAGMFASPEHGGNRDKIGWKLIGFNDQFSWAAPFGWYDRDVR